MIRDSRFSSPGATQKASSATPCRFERLDLGVERGDVLGAPVVGEMLEPQLLRAWPRAPRARASCCRTGRCTRRSGCRGRRAASRPRPLPCRQTRRGGPRGRGGRLRGNVRRVHERTNGKAYQQVLVQRRLLGGEFGWGIVISSCRYVKSLGVEKSGSSRVRLSCCLQVGLVRVAVERVHNFRRAGPSSTSSYCSKS